MEYGEPDSLEELRQAMIRLNRAVLELNDAFFRHYEEHLPDEKDAGSARCVIRALRGGRTAS